MLILSPSSLIYNWFDECQKFTPQLDVVVSYGLKQIRDQIIEEGHQITITSYSSFRQDFETYQAFHYDYLILDEAQVIKMHKLRFHTVYVRLIQPIVLRFRALLLKIKCLKFGPFSKLFCQGCYRLKKSFKINS